MDNREKPGITEGKSGIHSKQIMTCLFTREGKQSMMCLFTLTCLGIQQKYIYFT